MQRNSPSSIAEELHSGRNEPIFLIEIEERDLSPRCGGLAGSRSDNDSGMFESSRLGVAVNEVWIALRNASRVKLVDVVSSTTCVSNLQPGRKLTT